MTTKNTSYSSEKEIKEIWKLFRETDRKMKESSEKMERERLKSQKEMHQLGEYLQKNSEATEREMKESSKATDRKLREIFERMKENQEAIRRTNEKWGDFMEAITTAGLVKALNNFGIKINHTSSNHVIEYKDTVKEFDIVARNGKELVVVEVKTSLRRKHVKEFLNTLKDFKHYFKGYKNHKVYGAMAYLKEIHAKDIAEKSGLLILTPKGNTVEIKNSPGFQPKVFAE